MATAKPARKRPANLIYDVDDKPPWGVSLLLGVQHLCLLSIAFIFPVVIVKEIGGTPEQAENLICMAMITVGVSTILQGLGKGPIGSGYLCPTVNGPAFLSASLLAGKAGGLPLIFGMTAIGGVFEGLFSRVVGRLRPLFPAEVTGTVVIMVGIEVIPVAGPKLLGVGPGSPKVDGTSVLVALSTLAVMAGLNVWGKGKLRLFSVLVGMTAGYLLAAAVGIFGQEQLRRLAAAPVFKLPAFAAYGMSFDQALLIPFLVATLCSILKTVGDLTTTQKINDAAWKRPEMKSIGAGVLACSIGNVLSGLVGALGLSPSSSNIGLSMATGATSRRVAFTTGGIVAGLAFVPKLAAIFVVMPPPVMGAALTFAGCFMIMAGIQIITARAMDSRKIFVIGLSIMFGLGIDLVPKPLAFPPWFAPVAASSLSLATISALVLNLLFRLGIKKRVTYQTDPARHRPDAMSAFVENNGAAWGARKDVIERVYLAMNEFMEAYGALRRQGPVAFELAFDELALDVAINYSGAAIALQRQRPDPARLVQDEDAVAELGLYLMARYADKVQTKGAADRQTIALHFEH